MGRNFGVLCEADNDTLVSVSDTLEELCATWRGSELCEMSVLLSATRALAMLHQTHHWVSRGESYYGDHLLFDRLYNDVNGEADRVAEKLVGLSGNVEGLNPVAIAAQATRVLELIVSGMPADLALVSLEAERFHVSLLSAVVTALDMQGKLTDGLDNLLAELADAHEGNVYLLSRRVSA